MVSRKYSSVFILLFLLLSVSLYGQNILDVKPYDGTPGSFLMTQIKADTTANHGILPDRVYQLKHGGLYLNTEIFNVDSGRTIRFASDNGTGRKPIIFMYPTGTGATPGRPPGNLFVSRGGNIEMTDVLVSGYFEPVDTNINQVQGGLINTTQPGANIILDKIIFTNINGQHVRTGSASRTVKITNSVFANMGALTTSNFGAGKGIDLREASCDSLILVNNTFVNYQDRVVRHYNVATGSGGQTANIGYTLIDHNSFINGMGFHGLLNLGNVGSKVTITNNLFVDGFAAGEDSLDATRKAEWANTGETYADASPRMAWIFTAPNDTTNWTIKNNFYAVSDSGQAFLDINGLKEGAQLTNHINTRLGAEAGNAFTKINLTLTNIPKLMTNLMRWYRSPNGGNMTKNTPSPLFNFRTDDMDRKGYKFYTDSLNVSYPTTSAAYKGGSGYPAGNLNAFPDKKALWEAGVVPFSIAVDGEKDAFYSTLTGTDDGYIQLRNYNNSNNGRPANDADLSAKIWTAWDDEWLYMYYEVKDDTISGNATNVYEEDETELKFDPQPTDSTGAGTSIFDTRLTILGTGGPGVVSQDSLNNITAANKKFARKITADGYVLELAIKWPVITSSNGETVTVGVGNKFGMAINVHDNDGSARRQASLIWAAAALDLVWSTTKYHGTVTFLADNKLKFEDRNNVTGLTNPAPFDGSDYEPVGVERDPSIPLEFSLGQNYPNPFNPSTKISFTLDKAGFTVLSIYDFLGQKVGTLVSNELSEGVHEVNFDASKYSSGVYFYKLEQGNKHSIKKMILMK